MLAKLLKGSHLSIVLNEYFEDDGASVYRAACQLGCEGTVSKRLGSPYRSGRVAHWVKVKNPKAPAVKREVLGSLIEANRPLDVYADHPAFILEPG
jgi:ATP-dependent DNA ligase